MLLTEGGPTFGGSTMSQTEYEAAVAQFVAKKSITRCPTACVTSTHATVAESDVAALRSYSAAKEAERLEKIQNFQQRLTS